MRFAAPEFLFLLLALPVWLLMMWGRRRRIEKRFAKLCDPELSGLLLSLKSDRKSIVKQTLLMTGLTLLIFALAQPQFGGKSTLVKREGIDIVFALDISKSMLVQDIRPSRLKRATLEISMVLDQLKGDRVAIVAFAGQAFVQCPLTTDYAAAKMFLRSLSPQDASVQGTAIGSALDLSHKLLTSETGNSGSRVVVLLTDGEDHSPETKKSIETLANEKIPVFAIGIGSNSGEPVPEIAQEGDIRGYLKDKSGKTVMSRMDEGLLRNIAQLTDGRFVNLQTNDSQTALKEFIARMQKLQFDSAIYTQYDEKFPWLLWPSLIMLLLSTLLDDRRGSRWFGFRA